MKKPAEKVSPMAYNPSLPLSIQVDDEPPITVVGADPCIPFAAHWAFESKGGASRIRVFQGDRELQAMTLKPSAPGQVKIEISLDIVHGDVTVSVLGSGRGEGGLTPLAR